MNRAIMLVALALGLLALMPAATGAIDETTEPTFQFVVSAPSGSVEGDTLTLDGVPSVLYFSDRPHRIAGHMTVDEFVQYWNEGSDSFEAIPPNAALSVLVMDGVENTVVELSAMELEDDALVFSIVVLEGDPATGAIGPASLFVDPDTVAPIITDSV